jgi:hypothetical protein
VSVLVRATLRRSGIIPSNAAIMLSSNAVRLGPDRRVVIPRVRSPIGADVTFFAISLRACIPGRNASLALPFLPQVLGWRLKCRRRTPALAARLQLRRPIA